MNTLFAILLPLLIFMLLLVTVIGIPLDLILLAGLLIYIYSAKIVVGFVVGQKALKLLNKKAALGWVIAVGLFIYYIVTLIPLIGFVIWLIAGLMGLGAILIERKYTYTALKHKNVI